MSNVIMLPASGVLGTSAYPTSLHTSVQGWGSHPMSATDLGTSEFDAATRVAGTAAAVAPAAAAVARKRGRPPRGEPR